MAKHHVKHKKHHEGASEKEERLESARQAGFFSFNIQKFMSKRDKFLIIGIALGVVALFVATAYLILGDRDVDVATEPDMKDPVVLQQAVNKKIDEMTSQIKEATVIINPRSISPNSVTIKTGGNVGFFNEESTPITIQGYDNASEILNIGPVAPYDVPVVVFERAGTYKYFNPQNPQDIATIIVSD